LALENGNVICTDGMNSDFPIQCSPFGGMGPVVINTTGNCSCNCGSDILTVNVSPDD
jgi:hypothetical protein